MNRRILPLLGALSALALSPVPSSRAADDYVLGPESTTRADGVPRGRIESFEFTASTVYAETRRQVSVYVPSQYDAARPAALMVFLDGRAYVGEQGSMRVPIVFDNLIAAGDMPVTIGVFVDPGTRGATGRSNRSFEYDSLGDAYARFLLDELLPEVARRFELRVSDDPRLRAICGMSSGGIGAFTAAWERPDSFGKVLSHIGSFTNIRGGHVYPALIRKTERKPIRVFLQDGSNDLDNLHGNWPLANQQMASALAFAGYDHRFVLGDGGHSPKHGGAILPESLRWLWRPELESLPAPITKDNLRGDEALSKVLDGGGEPGDWELVGEGYAFTDGAAATDDGDFWFSDLPRGDIWRVPADGGVPERWMTGGAKLSGLDWGTDGKLYAASQGLADASAEGAGEKRIVVIDPITRAVETVATRVEPNDLVVSPRGFIYFTDTRAGTVVRCPTSARGLEQPGPVAGGIARPNGIALSADGGLLVVSEYGGRHGWTYIVDDAGDLRCGERNLELRVPVGRDVSGGDGMILDASDRSYITSHLGIQMFDGTGRMGGVIARPDTKGIVSCAFAGVEHRWLFVCSSDKVYRRMTLTQGSRAKTR